MQKLMLNVPYTRSEPVFSPSNQDKTYFEECRIRNLLTCEDDFKHIIKYGYQNSADVEKIREWIQYFAQNDWLDPDYGNEYLASLMDDEQNRQDAIYQFDEENCGQEDITFGDLLPAPKSNNLELYLQQMNHDQTRAYHHCTNLISFKNNEHNNQCLTTIFGHAGTGKSFLLKALVQFAQSMNLTIAVMAPTGIAT